MKPAHPVVFPDMREITGHVRPMALANAIHARVPSSWGGAFFITLNNIRDCIDAGDRWFEEETTEGFRRENFFPGCPSVPRPEGGVRIFFFCSFSC